MLRKGVEQRLLEITDERRELLALLGYPKKKSNENAKTAKLIQKEAKKKSKHKASWTKARRKAMSDTMKARWQKGIYNKKTA